MDPKIKALTERRAACIAEMKQLLGDNTVALTVEQAAQYDALEAECKAIPDQIKAVEADNQRMAARAASLKTLESTQLTTGRQSAPDYGGRGETSTIVVKPDGFLSDPKRGFADHREFLSAVMNLQSGNTRDVDARLKSLMSSSRSMTAGSDEAGAYSDPYGGFLVPAGFSPQLLSTTAESDPTAGLTTAINMTNPTVSFNAKVDKDHSTSVSGGLRVYRRKETQTVDPSRMQFEQVELKATALMGVAYASEEILARSPVSFVSMLDAGFSDEFRTKMLKEKLYGTGVGEFEGIMNAPALITVNKETGQAADTIVKENIDKMRARCWRYGRAIWLANHDTLPQLRSLVQAIGTAGVPISYFSTSLDGQAMLDGRPLYFTEFAQTVGDLGDLILAVWSEVLEGTLTGLSSAESIHVRFVNYERTFRFHMENDARSWWRSALTPNKGSTLSPFVTLQART
jgi:HK97 family phage major capsid protein